MALQIFWWLICILIAVALGYLTSLMMVRVDGYLVQYGDVARVTGVWLIGSTMFCIMFGAFGKSVILTDQFFRRRPFRRGKAATPKKSPEETVH